MRFLPRPEIPSRRFSVCAIAVPREAAAGEGRVALVPETVGRLVADGFEVVVERGAGAAAGFPDEDYAEAGATLREAGACSRAPTRSSGSRGRRPTRSRRWRRAPS